MAMDETYTIGELANAVEVPTSTVRYYERRGLLAPDTRSRGNYRLYGEASLDRLRFIRAAQGAGFTLSDAAALLELREESGSPNQRVQTLIDERLRQVAEQIKHLQHVEQALNRWRRRCREAESAGRCEVIEGLAACGGRRPKRNSKIPRKALDLARR